MSALTIAKSKELRVTIDDAHKKAEGLRFDLRDDTDADGNGEVHGGRELSLAITKLQEAKMWVGKVMEEIDHPLPEEFRDELVEKTN